MSPDWSAMFVPGGSLAEVFLRGTIVYLAIFAMLRALPRRQVGSLGVADLIVIVLVADAAQNGMAGEYHSITEGLLLVATIFFWDYAIDWLDFRFPRLHLNAGKPVTLISDGKVHHQTLARQRMSIDELRTQIRAHGIQEVSQVRKAVLEGDGRISVIPAPSKEEIPRGAK